MVKKVIKWILTIGLGAFGTWGLKHLLDDIFDDDGNVFG